MNGELDSLEAGIEQRRNKIELLLRQSALMLAVAKGFNTAEQKTLANNISRDLKSEAQQEKNEVNKLMEKYASISAGENAENKISFQQY